jgi:hypothetical protein
MTELKSCIIVGILFGIAGGIAPSPLHAESVTETYTFTGTCEDCTGAGEGALVLQNYTLGDEFTVDNFVSFTYSSNLLAFDITEDQIHEFYGSFTSLPGPADVYILSDFPEYFNLQTSSDGSWCAGSECLGDYGYTSVWAAANSPSAVPEPAVWALTLIGLATMVLVRRRSLSRAE